MSYHATLSRVGTTRHTECDLKVTRIVRNIESQDLAQAQGFYGDILGLDLMMDLGWVRTYGSKEMMAVQISVLSEGGSGTPVPELSIEVDDIEEAFLRMRAAKVPIEYGPADEPWGVRRFYVRDPFGKLINVLAHT
jgi:catechol 2,3-dioxygenase-like lactoylglutathione lyase family enzyme